MPTKTVLRRQAATRDLRAAIETHETLATDGLIAVLTPLLEDGEELPIDLPRFQQLLVRLLDHNYDQLVDADQAHEAQLKEDLDPRRRRDRLTPELARQIRACRRDFIGAFGLDQAEGFLKLSGEILTTNPVGLLRQARQVVDNLRNPDLATPPGLLPSSTFDREGWAQVLEPLMSDLQTALDDLDREVSEDRETRSFRQQALERMDDVLVTVAGLMRQVYRLGNQEDFIAEISPVFRRRRSRSSTSEPSDGSPPEGGEETPETSPPGPPEQAPAAVPRAGGAN